MGKDAKPAITKPAKPFDQAALMQQMMGGAGPPAARARAAGARGQPAPTQAAGTGAEEVDRRGPGQRVAAERDRGADAEAPRRGAAAGRGGRSAAT